MSGQTCDGLGWCVKRDAAPLGEPYCNGAGRCVKGYAAPSSSAARDGDSEGLREQIAETLHDHTCGPRPVCLACQDEARALLAGPLRQLVTERDEAVAAVERAAKLAEAWIDYEETEADPLSQHALIGSAGRDLRRALDGA